LPKIVIGSLITTDNKFVLFIKNEFGMDVMLLVNVNMVSLEVPDQFKLPNVRDCAELNVATIDIYNICK
jgi:hypothetical protein